ncbi:hypothetical protein VTL71DRAFT_6666 [Oculimacula yallundae]|uniref:Uncharacterized protein n=1 Tax=Oculimacula yallundae TaxID=86028 RepID=A0ABR4BXL8_9HELO
MLAIKYLLVLIPATFALITKRDFGTIVNDMANIDSKGKSLATTLQSWSSSNGAGIFGAIPILMASNALESAIRTATTHAEQSSQLTEEQSASLGALIKTLKTDTSGLLAAMKAKKPDFAGVGALPIARNSISSLTDAQDKYSTSLINVTPAVNKMKGEQDKADFDAFFKDAADYYRE